MRVKGVNVQLVRQAFIDSEGRRLESGFLAYNCETLELQVSSDGKFAGSDTFQIMGKDPAALSGNTFLFESEDISQPFTDLPNGKIAFLIDFKTTALNSFLGAGDEKKRVRVEIIKKVAAAEDEIILHGDMFIQPDVIQNTETTTT